MRTRKRFNFGLWAALALFLGAALLVPSGCGGGGLRSSPLGGGGFSVSDLGGSWFGPGGTSTTAGGSVGTGTAGMTADPSGNIPEFRLNGAPEPGVTGAAALADSFRGIFTFTRSDGRQGILMMAQDKDHLLYVDNQFRFAAFQRDATTLQAPYDNIYIHETTWTGAAAQVNASMALTASLDFNGSIDQFGMLNANGSNGRTAMTSELPMNVIEMANGQFAGDYIDNDNPPNTGNGLFLMTPDKRFMAGQFCNMGGAFPADCLFAIWSTEVFEEKPSAR